MLTSPCSTLASSIAATARAGCSGYCTEILRFSEAVAYNLIKAARAARKFPVILDLLPDGSVNLTTVRPWRRT